MVVFLFARRLEIESSLSEGKPVCGDGLRSTTECRRRDFSVMAMRSLNRYVTHLFVLANAATIAFTGCTDSHKSSTGQAETIAPVDSQNEELEPNESLLSGLELEKLSQHPDDSSDYSCPHFQDVAQELGVNFQYDNGESAEKLMTQATGGSVAWVDYDRDGYIDLLLGQGGSPLQEDRATNPIDQLYRNLEGERFINVTNQAGLRENGYSQGVAVADYDNDGFDDIYITNVGLDTFYRNMGDGTFAEATLASNLVNRDWGASAAWGDLNEDGSVDLFVCNYTVYDPSSPIQCFRASGKPGICHPKDVDPQVNRFFVNGGDGTFTEKLSESGLDAPGSKSLGVVIADFNGDRHADIYVANDTTANHLFINKGDLVFEETAILAGAAVSGKGLYQASMGVGFGDVNHDGHPDLYLTHFTSDFNTLYRGLGNGMFTDVTQDCGLHLPTLKSLGFGTIIADFDCNGSEDIFVANGHIDDSFTESGDAFKMQPQLFTSSGSRWTECSSTESGEYFNRELLGRGVAKGDFDRDGDIDLAISHQLDDAAILRNDKRTGHWLKVNLLGTTSNRNGIGALVKIVQGDQHLYGQLPGGTSYCASHEHSLFFGLGESDSNTSIEVRWPSGLKSVVDAVPVDQEILIQEAMITP
ncbi:MAG: CRTAC1 family protein [Planctomycetaceae bacterium]|nr:CRTAC1 family protein [Planctomycetaceae bacterium]